MKTSYRVLLLIILVGNGLCFGQSYSRCDTLELTTQAKDLLTEKFLPKLDNILTKTDDLPPEGIVQRIRGLITSCFYSEKVTVYNDFNPDLPSELPILNYLTLNHSEVAGVRMDWETMRYRLGSTRAGLILNLYGQKTVQLTNGKALTNLLEFRLRFTELNPGFTDYKIVGIRKIANLPANTRPLLASTVSLNACRQQELSLGFVLKRLAISVRRQLPTPVRKVVLEKFTYNDAGITNTLSDEVFNLLRTELFSQGIEASLPVRSTLAVPIRVKGSYIRDVNELKFRAEVIDNQSGKKIGSAENGELPIRWLSENKLPLEPDNLVPAIAVQDTIRQGTIPTNAGQGLTIRVNTNKGRDGVEFYEGQKMTLTIRSSKPCFVRIIYLFQDGTKTLLVDNYPIRSGQENQDIPIETAFDLICSPPFGQEYLLAFAASDSFKMLPLRKQDGYDIIDGSLTDILKTSRVRAFSKVSKEQTAIAEDRIKVVSRAL